MPGFDGTGPRGYGPLTGRGLGPCGAGRGWGRGFGWRRSAFGSRPFAEPMSEKEYTGYLEDVKADLETQMERIDRRLKEIRG